MILSLGYHITEVGQKGWGSRTETGGNQAVCTWTGSVACLTGGGIFPN